MTGTCAACLHTNQSRSYLNHLVIPACLLRRSQQPVIGPCTETKKKSDIQPPPLLIWGFSQNCKKRLLASTVRLHATSRLPLDGFSRNFIFVGVLENLSRKFKFYWNKKRITGTLHKGRCTFMISRRFLLRMRNVADKSCRENQIIILCSVIPPRKIVTFIRWGKKVEQHRQQMKNDTCTLYAG